MKQTINMNNSLFHYLRTPSTPIRALNSAILLFFITTFYAPSALAVKQGIEEQQRKAELEASLHVNQSEVSMYAAKLRQMKGHFSEAERLYVDKSKALLGNVTDIEGAVKTGGSIFKYDDRWKQELAAGLAAAQTAITLNKVVDADFKKDQLWLQQKQLPEVFDQRFEQSYGDYQQRYKAFTKALKPLQQAKTEEQQYEALKTVNAFLKDQQFGRKHQAFDKASLGNSAPKSAKDKSLLLSQADYFNNGIESNPSIQVAALGDFDYSNLANADNPAFLEASDEVVLSQAIKDKAAELNHDPVTIYHWVRNNIETIPGYGSYQNSELTLGAKRGNPFDVASLLIALLRASKIPARYAFGVAEIDVDRYNNWLGNFDNVSTATNYASNNGIVTQAVVSAGKISKVRTQHIWVQAAIDYFPSRGAKNRSADSWVDMDASFKQYDYQAGLDALAITGIDAEALATQFVESGTVDEDAGYVQNLDATELLNAQQQAQEKLKTHIEGMTDPTVGDVIGGRRTIVKEYPVLPSGLPYKKFRQGATYSKLPTNLQNRIALGFGSDRISYSFAQVNNQKFTVQFTPATEADEQALAKLLPEGDITDVSQLPSSIPSHLVSVIPELSLNGTVVKRADAMRLGSEVNVSYQLSGPLTTYAPYNYSVIAGSYLNIPVVAQSVNPEQLKALQTKVEQTKAILESQDQAQLSTLTRDQVLGDLFYAGGLGYFAQYIGLSHIAALQSKGSHKLEFGYGSYGYEPEVDTFFSIPRGIKTGGAAMNIRLANTVETQQGSNDKRVQLRFQAGLISSALEHAVPEQMFSDRDNPTDGVSAVKALQIAAKQGQKIYQINKDNLNSALSELRLDQFAEDEIRNFVKDNRMAIAHTDNITVPGWKGAGYILLDQDTGVGSYKISGGGNGGFVKPKEGDNKLLFDIANFINNVGKFIADFFDVISELADSGGWIAKFFSGILKTLTVAFDVLKLIKECSDSENFSTALWAFGFISAFIFFVTGIIGLALAGVAGVLLGILVGAILGRLLLEPSIKNNCE